MRTHDRDGHDVQTLTSIGKMQEKWSKMREFFALFSCSDIQCLPKLEMHCGRQEVLFGRWPLSWTLSSMFYIKVGFYPSRAFQRYVA